MLTTLNKLKKEDGYVMVWTALFLVIFLLCLGLVIDVALLYTARADLQNDIDASALAGIQGLVFSNDECARYAFKTYALNNGDPWEEKDIDWPDSSTTDTINGDSVTVTTPYNDDPFLVEVKATRQVKYAFMDLVGLSGSDVSARAVAKGAGSFVVSVFATSETGNTQTNSEHKGVSFVVVGEMNEFQEESARSNQSVYIGGKKNKGSIFYADEFVKEDGNPNITGEKNDPQTPPVFSLSEYKERADYMVPEKIGSVGGTWDGSTWTIDNDLISGIYYVEGNVKFNKTGIGGTATIVADGYIYVNKNDINLSNADDEYHIVLYADGFGDALRIEGNKNFFWGTCYVPHGCFTISGEQSKEAPPNTVGSVIADTINIETNKNKGAYSVSYAASHGDKAFRLAE